VTPDVFEEYRQPALSALPARGPQRCMVHFYRNVFSHVPATKVREVSHMLKADADTASWPLEALQECGGPCLRFRVVVGG
jgi:transposase-like protein